MHKPKTMTSIALREQKTHPVQPVFGDEAVLTRDVECRNAVSPPTGKYVMIMLCRRLGFPREKLVMDRAVGKTAIDRENYDKLILTLTSPCS